MCEGNEDRTRAEYMAFCYRSKSIHVLYNIEDSPLGRCVRGMRTGPGLSTWLSVTGAELLLKERTVLCRTENGPQKRRTGLRTWLFVTGEKLTQVLYSIEDSPLGRQVKGTRRTGLRTWLSVTGAKVYKYMYCTIEDSP